MRSHLQKKNRLKYALIGGCLLAVSNHLFAFSQSVVTANGRIVPASGIYEVAASMPNAVIGELTVEQGDTVKKEQVLASLTTVSVAELKARNVDVEIAALQAQKKIIEARVNAVQLGVRAAQAKADETKARAFAEIEKLEGKLTDLQDILENKDPPRRDREEIKFEQKILNREIFEQKGNLPYLIKTLEAEVAQSSAQAPALQAELSHIDTQLAQAKANQQLLRLQFEAHRIKAPIAGTVLSINTRVGERVGARGLLRLASLEKLEIEAEVYIDDIRRVQVGNAAKITGDGFEGALDGIVRSIEPQVADNNIFEPDPSAFTDRRVVRVKIALDAAASSKVKALLNAQVIVRIEIPDNVE